MNKQNLLFRIIAFLTACFVFDSCIYEVEEGCNMTEDSAPFKNGFSLNFAVTLDNLGGTRSSTNDDLREYENYIDPEKFRVLFFDNKDQFLFESKSRWVKQLAPNENGEQWLVSVPMYPYGNDTEYNWDWDEIRKVMTTEEDGEGVSFKIAILANRPETEVYTDLETDPKYEGERGLATTFQNNGPAWKQKDTRFSDDPASIKKIIDLHHCQFDPIYRDKGAPTESNKKWATEKFGRIYQSFTGLEDNNIDKPLMGATSSWVDYGPGNDDKNNKRNEYPTSSGTNTRRYARKADKNYPIPMYGVQNFGKITNWIIGVPFNLSAYTNGNNGEQAGYNFKSIALLRSVVKLELVLPKKYTHNSSGQNISNGNDLNISYAALCYSNIFARCEPMDVWTPTDELWTQGHHDGEGNTIDDCEWFKLKSHGRLVKNDNNKVAVGDLLGGDEDMQNMYAYRRRLAWFYGAWAEKGWPFPGVTENNNGTGQSGLEYVKNLLDQDDDTPPRIFNPCIQRNLRVIVDKDNIYDYNDDYYHYVVYTGERNQIDPNHLYRIDRTDALAPTICYWLLIIDGYVYAFPITQYENNPQVKDLNSYANLKPGQDMPNSSEVSNHSSMAGYATNMVDYSGSVDNLPWPLLRNHHYTITVGGVATRANGTPEFTVSSKEQHSETLKAY